MEGVASDKFDNPTILQRYAGAAEIADAVLLEVIDKCVPGASISEICLFGDNQIKERCSACFNKKENGEKLRKGIAFPTCISVNEIIGHCAPLDDTQEPNALKEGDLVKIDLGVQIGGLPVILGHTIVCGNPDKVTGRKADVVLAAHTAAEAAIRALKVGASNYDVTQALEKGYTAYQCVGVHGVLHHEIGKNLIDGKNIIHNRDFPDERVDEFTLEPYQAFLLEATASTGPGKARESVHPTVIYKRDADNDHELRTVQARQFFSELKKHRPVFPFHVREDPEKSRRNLGVAECLKNYMIQAFPCVTEVEGEYVAKFAYTALVFPNGQKKLGGNIPMDICKYESKHNIEDPELLDLLTKPYAPVSKSKLKKQAKRTGGADELKGEEPKGTDEEA